MFVVWDCPTVGRVCVYSKGVAEGVECEEGSAGIGENIPCFLPANSGTGIRVE